MWNSLAASAGIIAGVLILSSDVGPPDMLAV